mgnify:CR=1 FL=1
MINKMTRSLALTALILLLLPTSLSAQESQRRLVRLESRIYGWYAVVEPSFDLTVGRRELFKVSGKDQFLKGLAGRLVVLEGVYQEGTVHLPALAPPPISVPVGSQRRVFVIQGPPVEGVYSTEGGYRVRDPQQLLDPGSDRQRADLIVAPGPDENSFEATYLVSGKELAWERPPTRNADEALFCDLTLTQDILDNMTRLGLAQADLQTSYQGLRLELSQLRIQLPDRSESVAQSWELQGSIHLSFRGTTRLAESSFVVGARPVIENDTLKLKPDWQRIQLEGQLPFSFVLSGGQLGEYAAYLPQTVPLFDMSLITGVLRDDGLLPAEEEAHWYLLTPAPGTARFSLASSEPVDQPEGGLEPGRFRLFLGQQMVDRLIKHQVSEMLDPDSPYRPDPPIEVGKALFIPIVVEEVFVRNLDAGYSQGAFRFSDLVIDVGWRAGPVTGLEPLLKTSGMVVPRLAQTSNGQNYWSWVLTIDQLEVRSDKIPGKKEDLAREFKPQIEKTLGPELAAEKRYPTRLALSEFLAGGTGALEITLIEALADGLKLEGRLTP